MTLEYNPLTFLYWFFKTIPFTSGSGDSRWHGKHRRTWWAIKGSRRYTHAYLLKTGVFLSRFDPEFVSGERPKDHVTDSFFQVVAAISGDREYCHGVVANFPICHVLFTQNDELMMYAKLMGVEDEVNQCVALVDAK